MIFKLSYLNSNLALTLGYLNPALNNSALELISWGPHSSLERERKFRCRLFMSSTKREISHFRVVVVQ